MEMMPVESSNIQAIGFDSGSLRVRFRDGSEYDYADVTQGQHAAFLDAPSKGKWLNEFVIGRSGRKTQPTIALREPRKPARRDMFHGSMDEQAESTIIHSTQAEGCCGVALNAGALSGKLDNAESFTCPKCGAEYKPKAFGPLVSWEYQIDAVVF